MKEKTRENVLEVISEQLDMEPGKLVLDKPLVEQGVDSLGAIEVVLAVEEAFDCTVPDDEDPGKLSPADLLRYAGVTCA